MRDRLIELLEEYASCRNELDPFKVAAEIREVVEAELKDDLVIAKNMQDFQKHQISLAADWRG